MSKVETNVNPVVVYPIAKVDKPDAFELYFDEDASLVERSLYEELLSYGVEIENCEFVFYKLSNSGFFIHPKIDGEYRLIKVKQCNFEFVLNEVSIGLIAALNVYKKLQLNGSPYAYEQHYSLLEEFALQHQESAFIMHATEARG